LVDHQQVGTELGDVLEGEVDGVRDLSVDEPGQDLDVLAVATLCLRQLGPSRFSAGRGQLGVAIEVVGAGQCDVGNSQSGLQADSMVERAGGVGLTC
jgi:hypothetical protein